MKDKCYRCGRKATEYFEICADSNRKRWVCDKCDVLLNEIVLKFMRFRNWKSKMRKYRLKK